MQKSASYWIEKLGLSPLPEEGGMYKETYRSKIIIPQNGLPQGYRGLRVALTDIFYLLQGKTFSAFHRLRSDEIWHFHVGSTMLVHIIYENSCYECIQLGPADDVESVLRVTFSSRCWFAAEMKSKNAENFALVSCVVAPGFEFQDFEIGNRSTLLKQFPNHKEIITRLTRE